jgi:hypothetical protein
MLIHLETPEIAIYCVKERQKTILFCRLSSVGDVSSSGGVQFRGSFEMLVHFSGCSVSSQKTTVLL